VTTNELLLIAGPGLASAIFAGVGLRARFGSLFNLALPMVVAAALAILFSFFSTFTVAWTVHGTLPIVLAAVASAVLATAIVIGTATRVSAY